MHVSKLMENRKSKCSSENENREQKLKTFPQIKHNFNTSIVKTDSEAKFPPYFTLSCLRNKIPSYLRGQNLTFYSNF